MEPCYALTMNEPVEMRSLEAAAERMRQACIACAKAAYFEAAASGLCGEGAIEAALGAMQSLDVDRVLRELADGAP